MPAKKTTKKTATKKTTPKKKSTRVAKKPTASKETSEEMQASIARLLLGIIGISIFIAFFLTPGPF